ncbi:chloride channel protein, partial [Escherichia coli]|uniref:chloride channel protein n=1 Tax=Escherichia coli TaxID=562 RepID=UPI003CC7C5C8
MLARSSFFFRWRRRTPIFTQVGPREAPKVFKGQTVKSFLTAPPLLMIIAGIFLCKLCAVLASSGSGAPGGVFTPRYLSVLALIHI